ncbi:hypothetical protein GC163_00095 [bacterium]|nr:hypothetical protein [bacterium]
MSSFPLRLLVAGLLLSMGHILPVDASVYSPRVRTAGTPDRLSAHTWLRESAVSLDERALQLLDDMSRLTVVAQGPQEGPDKLVDFSTVRDPLKLWHVYGYATERDITAAFVTLWSQCRGDDTRLIRLGDSGHYFAEIEIDGQRAAFDVVRHAAFPKSNGGFYSMKELIETPVAWEQPRGPRFYPDSDPQVMAKLVREQPHLVTYFPSPLGHTGDFVLRRGMTFTQYFTPQGQRWLLPATLLKDKKALAELERSPAGPKLPGSDQPLHANGQLVYQPPLTANSGGLEDAGLLIDNVTAAEQGWTVAKDGTGSVILDLRTPYVIVPELGKLADAKDDAGASVIDIDGTGLTLTCSLDNGVTWLGLETKTFPATVDLTDKVTGAYGYLLRIAFKGKPDEAVVKSLKITTWVQLAATSLPALQPGNNTLQIGRNDETNQPTRTFTLEASTADENSYLAPVIRPPREFHPGDATARVIGPFTGRITPPLGTELTHFDIIGRFACDRSLPVKTVLRIHPTFRGPGEFDANPQPYETSFLIFGDHAGEDVQMTISDSPMKRYSAIYFLMEGQPALNDLRIVTRGVETVERPVTPWTITHRWTAAGEAKEQTIEVGDNVTSYEIDTGADIVNTAVEFRVP